MMTIKELCSYKKITLTLEDIRRAIRDIEEANLR